MAGSSTGNRLIILAVLAVAVLIVLMLGINWLRDYRGQVHDYDSCMESGGELVQTASTLPPNCHYEDKVYPPLR